MRYALGYVLVIWTVHIINMVLFAGQLNYFGIHPLDVASLWHIFTAPLLHGSLDHLIANTLPGALFCYLISKSGARAFWEVTGIVTVVAGLGTWLIGGVGTTHIGASGLIYGWLTYLVVRGVFNRSLWQVVMGVVLAFTYSGLVWGVLPTDAGVSWQGHLSGAIGGFLAGAIITSDDPPATRARRQQKLQGKQGIPGAGGTGYGGYGSTGFGTTDYGSAGGTGSTGYGSTGYGGTGYDSGSKRYRQGRGL